MTPIKHAIPLPARALGQRGSVVALALWGVTSAQAQDPTPTTDTTEAVIIELAEGPPSGDIYGGPPMDEPDPEPWMFPSDLQGTWKSAGPTHTKQAHPAQLVITSDRYTLIRDGKTEAGRLEVMPITKPAGRAIATTYRVRMTERTIDAAPAPNTIVEWTLRADLSSFSTDNETFNRVVIEPTMGTKYGLPPDHLLDDKDLFKD